MNKTSKILLTGAGAAVAGAAAVGVAATAFTKYLVRVAMDRQQPKIPNYEKAKDHLRGSTACQVFMDKMAEAAERLETTPHHKVMIESYDGQHLVGHWFEVPNPKRVIVAMHGWRSCWATDFGTIADFWRKNGCCVLYAEQRGQGSSGGEYIGFGMMERYDCLEWVKWVNTHCDKTIPIYLAGVSMGATTVLMAAGLELPTNVRGIMADCGFTSANDIWKYVAEKNLHLNFHLHENAADNLCRARICMGSRECSTLDAMARCKVPVIFAHGTQDHFVPVEMTYENYKACAAPKFLLIVPGADHGMSHYMETEKYEAMMQEFWERYDALPA